MNRKEKHTNQNQTKKIGSEKVDFINVAITILFIGGIILAILEIYLYRKTIIDWKILTTIWFLGLVFYPFTSKYLEKHYRTTGYLLKSVFNIVAFGGMLSYLFMATNYYSANLETREYRFLIKEKSSISGPKGNRSKRKPVVKINYFNSEKELVFRYTDTDKVNKADSVIVSIRKGGLGFDILDKYDVFN